MKTLIKTPDALSEVATSIVPSLEKIACRFPFFDKIEIIEEDELIFINYFSLSEKGSISIEKKHGKLFLKRMIFRSDSAEFFTNWSAN